MLGSVAYGMARAFNSINRTYRSRNAFRRHPAGSPGALQVAPKNFTAFRDPGGRFILEYPADWKLTRKDGVHVSSARLGSFARVDILPDSPRFWEDLKRELAREGDEVQYLARNGSRPVHSRGRVRVRAKDTKFTWDAYAYPLGAKRLVLSLGNVVDSRRSKAIERYEDSILAAVRRHFTARSSG